MQIDINNLEYEHPAQKIELSPKVKKYLGDKAELFTAINDKLKKMIHTIHRTHTNDDNLGREICANILYDCTLKKGVNLNNIFLKYELNQTIQDEAKEIEQIILCGKLEVDANTFTVNNHFTTQQIQRQAFCITVTFAASLFGLEFSKKFFNDTFPAKYDFTQYNIPKAVKEYLDDETIVISALKNIITEIIIEVEDEIEESYSLDKAPSLVRQICAGILYDCALKEGTNLKEIFLKYDISKETQQLVKELYNVVVKGKIDFIKKDLARYGYNKDCPEEDAFVVHKIRESGFCAVVVYATTLLGLEFSKNLYTDTVKETSMGISK